MENREQVILHGCLWMRLLWNENCFPQIIKVTTKTLRALRFTEKTFVLLCELCASVVIIFSFEVAHNNVPEVPYLGFLFNNN